MIGSHTIKESNETLGLAGLCTKRVASILSSGAMSGLVQSYHALNRRHELEETVKRMLPEMEVRDLTKYDLHKIINEVLIEYYGGEGYFKSLLIDYFHPVDAVGALEVKTLNSRLDFLTINGITCSYEIKTDLDSLQKLEKQTADYMRLFDYNYVVIGLKHLKATRALLPVSYGIIVEQSGQLIQKRKAGKNKGVRADDQLKLFTKKELLTFFGEEDREVVLDRYAVRYIREQFKGMLKKRYARNWDFILAHKATILPLDYQYFFYHNLVPSLIYG